MTLQWYPGHMTKARRELAELMPSQDVVIEVIDARLPRASSNPVISELRGTKPAIKVLTKSDLADPEEFTAAFADLDVPVVLAGQSEDLTELTAMLTNSVTALIGHSGVGKSTLVNRLVPDAYRATGVVSGVGKGRHTSTQSVALPLPGGGWVVDTPGIRSFGLAHISPENVVAAFSDLADTIENCPRGCTHLGPPADPECALDTLTGDAARRVAAVRLLLEAVRTNEAW